MEKVLIPATVQDVVNTMSEYFNGKGARFIAIRDYCSKGTGGIADYLVCGNFKYTNAVMKDIAKLNVLIPTLEPGSLKHQAACELHASFVANLDPATASAASKAQHDTYTHIAPGCKVHNVTGEVYIYAMCVRKRTKVDGVKKEVKSKDITIAKNEIQKAFHTNKYRNFIIKLIGSTISVSGRLLDIAASNTVEAE
jgi:hypothetical protein